MLQAAHHDPQRKQNMLKNAPVIPYIPVADLARARKFYQDVVGLVPKEEINGGVIYECGGSPIFMYVSGGAGTSKASQAFWKVTPPLISSFGTRPTTS